LCFQEEIHIFGQFTSIVVSCDDVCHQLLLFIASKGALIANFLLFLGMNISLVLLQTCFKLKL
jgi:hypothetical protein